MRRFLRFLFRSIFEGDTNFLLRGSCFEEYLFSFGFLSQVILNLNLYNLFVAIHFLKTARFPEGVSLSMLMVKLIRCLGLIKKEVALLFLNEKFADDEADDSD